MARVHRIPAHGEDLMSDRIALVEDDPGGRKVASAMLSRAGMEVIAFASAEDFLRVRPAVSVVLTDLMMPGIDGLELMRQLKSNQGDDVEVVLITAFATADVAAQATAQGAFHFLTKPLDPQLLVETARRAAERVRLRSRVARLRIDSRPAESQEIIGASKAIGDLREQLARLAQAELPVLITGASGSGKELAARALHLGSGQDEPFVAVNCAALPANLLESELFGHLRGAFTGADARRKGRFLEAHGGTLFLDEVGEMPMPLQAKLLRVLERGEVTPLGADKPPKSTFDSSPQPTKSSSARCCVTTCIIDWRAHATTYPAWRSGDDVPILAAHFLARHGLRAPKLGSKALEALQNYDWPGNVRELAHTCDRLAALYPGADLETLPESLDAQTSPAQAGLIIDPELDTRSDRSARHRLDPRAL